MNVIVGNRRGGGNDNNDHVKSEAGTTTTTAGSLRGDYVSLYDQIPSCEMNLDDFELVALKRLRVLRLIEKLEADSRSTFSERMNKVRDMLKKQDLVRNKHDDETSHFILRLSYCQSEDYRRWFLQQETALLKYKLAINPGVATSLAPQLEPVSTSKKEELREKLLQVMPVLDYTRQDIYAVPFTQVLEMVANRSCYIQAGMAYLSHNQLEKLVLQQFRTDLSRNLMFLHSNAKMSAVQENHRIYPLLSKMHSVLTETTAIMDKYDNGQDGVTAATVPQLKAHMPLCMRNLQTGLEKDGKLKHWGRLQYGLFLKGTGLSLDEALVFFQRAFSPTTMADKFQKDYVYSIRHQYGKEGKRASYTPYNCTKIIHGNAPNAGEHHGCPYKHYDANHLSLLLRQLQIGNNDAERQGIVSKARDGHYQLACAEHFQVAHPQAVSNTNVSLDNVGNHPNAWFRASVQYHRTGSSKTGDGNGNSNGEADSS